MVQRPTEGEGITIDVGDRLSAERGVARNPEGPTELARDMLGVRLWPPHSLGEPRIAAGTESGRSLAEVGLAAGEASCAAGELGALGA